MTTIKKYFEDNGLIWGTARLCFLAILVAATIRYIASGAQEIW